MGTTSNEHIHSTSVINTVRLKLLPKVEEILQN